MSVLSWQSKKIKRVVRSSFTAETCMCQEHLDWMRTMWEQMTHSDFVLVHCDQWKCVNRRSLVAEVWLPVVVQRCLQSPCLCPCCVCLSTALLSSANTSVHILVTHMRTHLSYDCHFPNTRVGPLVSCKSCVFSISS